MTRRTLMLLGMLACIPPWGVVLKPLGLTAQCVGLVVQAFGLWMILAGSFREH